jgi:ABC-2 type transport system ATP-binding protein
VNILSFENISKSYGDHEALRSLSLDVKEGETFGLLGPNGAGKTTLIRILMDIIRPDGGQISLFGLPYSRDLLGRVGYLPEERGLYKKQKVLTVMGYFGRLRGFSKRESRQRALHWLEKVRLPEVADWRIERLSKGMSQKVQIACTLFVDPQICVLDEPFNGLDPVNLRLVQDLIKEREQFGLTTVLSTHQMNLVEALCDRVGLIHQGELMVYGEVSEVRQRFSRPEVRVQLDSPPPALDAVLETFPEDDSTWRLLVANGYQPEEVLKQLIQAGASVSFFEKTLAPLEDVFVQVVEEGAR